MITLKTIHLSEFFKRNGQTLLNIYLSINFVAWTIWQSYVWINADTFGYIEISFTVQSLVLTALIVLRKQHQVVDTNIFNQIIALIAFCSGVAFIGQPLTDNSIVTNISKMIVFAANILGLITLFNLGRSFGILIAFREIKTQGLYRLVRHPMYGTDILLRIGMSISHFNTFTLTVFIVSTACYIYRALLEEQFLSHQPEYREYMKKVKYRFIPGIF
jgi:protein-S-isoprenylcysteine O-methyltransferase Ste14